MAGLARPMRTLLIPAENQVRELDAKLLLSCVAAERGLRPILGYRTELDFRIASFPPSLCSRPRFAASLSPSPATFIR